MSIPASILYYVGQKLKQCKLTGGTIDGATGAFTKGTAGDIASTAIGTFDGVVFDLETNSVEISAANALLENEVPTKGRIRAEVTEISSSNGGSYSLGSFMNSSYVLLEVIVSSGGGTPVRQLIQFIGLCKSIHVPYEGEKSDAVLTLVNAGFPIYVGDPSTPLYS
jgi:hypothetical protein